MSYPDSESGKLRCCLAEKLGVGTENILVGNGSTELMRLVALAYFRPGDRVIIIEPTFGEYEVACQIAGVSLIRQWLSPVGTDLQVCPLDRFINLSLHFQTPSIQLKIEETITLIRQHHPRGIFIANPNNPTGYYLLRTEIERLLSAATESLVIMDEAYITFVDDAWSSLDMIHGGNLLILRSMTKDYALAGLRLGYGVAEEEIITTLRRVCPPWNVNTAAQQAGVVALMEDGYIEQCCAELRKTKDYLMKELTRLGFSPLPSKANFFMVEVGDAPEFRRRLLEHHILVRDCTSFGLPSYIRIASRTMPQCQRLVTTIEQEITTPCSKSQIPSSNFQTNSVTTHPSN